MTQQQYDRWLDFAVRMARACYPKKPRSKYQPSSAWIEAAVAEFIGEIDKDDICTIRSWDDSDPYPEGHTYHGEDRYGHKHRGPCIADMMSTFAWDGFSDIPLPKRVAKKLDDLSWGCLGEEADAIREKWGGRWYDQVRCCVRAGLDFACDPSGGVLGFTAGDLRKMYPEGVPDWVSGGDERWKYAMSDEVNGRFADMADAQELWL